MLEVFKVYIQFITAQFCHLHSRRRRRSFQPTIIFPPSSSSSSSSSFHRFLFIFFSTLSLIVIACIYLATHPARSTIASDKSDTLSSSFQLFCDNHQPHRLRSDVSETSYARTYFSIQRKIQFIISHTTRTQRHYVASYRISQKSIVVVFHEILFREIIEFSSLVYRCRSHQQHSVSFRRIEREEKSQANITQCRAKDKQTFTLFESSQLELWLELACTRSVKRCEGKKTFEENKIYLNWLSNSHEKWHLLTSSSYMMPYDFDKISDSFTAQQLVKSEGETDDPRVHLSCDSKNKQNRQAPMPLTQRCSLISQLHRSFGGAHMQAQRSTTDNSSLRFVHYIHSIF